MRSVLEILYRGEEEKILHRSLFGYKEGIFVRNEKVYFRPQKYPVSPEKRVALNIAFRARIQSFDIDPNEKYKRLVPIHVNSLVAKAITNMRHAYIAKAANMEAVNEAYQFDLEE